MAQSPIMTFKTTLYDNAGTTNAFHFYLGAKETTPIEIDFGYGKQEFVISEAVYDPTAGISGTLIEGSVGPRGTVSIYGDASLIDYVDIKGVYATTLDISQLTQLEILRVDYNDIEALDLSNHHKLQVIYANSNPFNVSPLKIGPNKPDLTILELSMVENLDPSLNISDYPNLAVFEAYATPTLTTCDPSQCPGLMKLTVDATNISSLDVSNNPELLILNIGETKITSIDLSNNPKLREFYCTHMGSMNQDYPMTSLDVSKNTQLQRLMCSGNQLTSIDVSNNPLLTSLFCNTNLLTSIDISKNPYIESLNVSNNYLDFVTLPEPRNSFIEYYYYQRPLPLDRSYAVNSTIDLTDRVVRPNSTTTAKLFTNTFTDDGMPSTVELPASAYRYENGKITLLEEVPDSVYITFKNSLLSEYELYTTNFKIKSEAEYGKPNPVITLRTSPGIRTVAYKIGMVGASPETPKTFYVDFGDGTLVEYTTTSAVLPEEANAVGDVKRTGSMTIYMPEGEDLTAFGVADTRLTSLDLSKAPLLAYLSVTNCGLNTVDISHNRWLYDVDLNTNNLSSINLKGANDRDDLTSLKRINLANNKLTSITPGFRQLEYADVSNNQLASINLLKASDMKELNLSHNLIEDVDLRDLEAIEYLDLSDNSLSSILILEYLPLKKLDISDNRFPLSTLPTKGAETLVYAPQKPWILPSKAPVADLSMQIVPMVIDPTVFKWYKADGTPVADDAIVETSIGLFRFDDVTLGEVYCEFSNSLFPALTGENTYRTTNIEVAPMPTEVVTTFKPLLNGTGEIVLVGKNADASIYVDWEGNGNMRQYIAGTTPTIFQVPVKKNVEVNFYAYDQNCGLTVMTIGAGPLKYIDASPLTELKAFSVLGSQLTSDRITLPASENLEEITITNANLTSYDLLNDYKDLQMIKLTNNQLTEFNSSNWDKLQVLYLDGNVIENVDLSNPLLWELGLTSNRLTEIDLLDLPALQQVWLSGNQLTDIDVEGIRNLRLLDIAGNNFNFNTLPEPKESYVLYAYAYQNPVEAVCDNGEVDLSMYGATDYRWFVGEPTYDVEADDYVGTELREGTDFTINGDVTTFKKSYSGVVCLMTNAKFPMLGLMTLPMSVSPVGVQTVSAESDEDGRIFDLQGREVKNPESGIYIRNGKKFVVR